ncbi:MAG: phosphoethanolamine transferase, partial [Steroidobacter sp.]
SHGYRQRENLSDACMRSQRDASLSHDNVYHTVLGALQTTNQAYDARLDVLASCRGSDRT